MNELSPRRVPRSPVVPPKTPPQWKRPDEVMRRHRMRVRQQALASKFKKPETETINTQPVVKPDFNFIQPAFKRKNPFKVNEINEGQNKKIKEDNDENDSLFRLLGLTDPQMNNESLNINDILKKIKEQSESQENQINKVAGSKSLSIDWSLRTKVRFISTKPFPWTQTLKTCEEASGTTGWNRFVRCMGSGKSSEVLDTSPNAVFRQCCLYWQHPSLPWLQLFPRSTKHTTEVKLPPIGSQPKIKEALHRDWTDSFRSLFQLVRVRHCPYFYMVANTFTCLFRAAGVNGQNQTNVMLSSTTVGFRQLLKDDGISFTLPLKKKESSFSQSNEIDPENPDEELDEDEESGETREWLESLGVDEAEIKKITESQEMLQLKAKKKIDGDYDSLIYIEGSEAQALFNFLINCKSIIPTTGPLSGVPPTLLAPVAFVGASLQCIKVRESPVNVENEIFYSMEIRGPVFPHTVMNLCSILQDNLDKYSVTFATMDSTKAFSLATKPSSDDSLTEKETGDSDIKNKSGQAFNQESLSDCGLQTNVLQQFCTDDIQPYDSIKYCDNLYVLT